MPAYPQYVREINNIARELARKLGVPVTDLINFDGLYIKPRHRRDPVNTNKKILVIKVQFRRNKQVVFEEIVERKGFPTELLIAKLALVI